MRYWYTALLYLLMPVIVLRLAWRSLKAPAYAKRWGERFGIFKVDAKYQHGIWVHAVSLGEAVAAIPLIKRLQKQYPHLPITVTTMTPTGSAQVVTQLGSSVFHVYAPYDLPDAWQRFYKKIKPRLLIVMETELWPNMLHAAKQNNVPVVIANARLSARSARGYQKIARVTRELLNNITMICAQHKHDGERFIKLGLPQKNLTVTGSIKFDIEIDETIKAAAHALRLSLGGRPVWIAASTHEGEEAIILAAHQQLLVDYPDLLLVLVPRHPERFLSVEKCCGNFKFNNVKRSQPSIIKNDTHVLLGDTMGELALLYGLADVAFVGGSLVATGGHNVLEPVAQNVPTVVGPHMFNFNAITQELLTADGLLQITETAQLYPTIKTLFNEHERREQLASNAQHILLSNQGALDRLLEQISAIIDQQNS